jgi:hypothetical protein
MVSGSARANGTAAELPLEPILPIAVQIRKTAAKTCKAAQLDVRGEEEWYAFGIQL